VVAAAGAGDNGSGNVESPFVTIASATVTTVNAIGAAPRGFAAAGRTPSVAACTAREGRLAAPLLLLLALLPAPPAP